MILKILCGLSIMAVMIMLAQSGFGCSAEALGRKVYGVFLTDGEKCQYYRNDFLGILKDELLPDWAKEKLEEINTQTAESNQNQGGMTPSL